MFFFQWIRSKVRDAVLAGLSDAAQEIDGEANGDGNNSTAAALANLRSRLQSLPPPAPEGNGEPAGASNGRRGRSRQEARS